MDGCGLIWARFRAYTTLRSDYAHSEVILRVCRSVDDRWFPEKYRTACATWRLATPQCTVTSFRPKGLILSFASAMRRLRLEWRRSDFMSCGRFRCRVPRQSIRTETNGVEFPTYYRKQPISKWPAIHAERLRRALPAAPLHSLPGWR